MRKRTTQKIRVLPTVECIRNGLCDGPDDQRWLTGWSSSRSTGTVGSLTMLYILKPGQRHATRYAACYWRLA